MCSCASRSLTTDRRFARTLASLRLSRPYCKFPYSAVFRACREDSKNCIDFVCNFPGGLLHAIKPLLELHVVDLAKRFVANMKLPVCSMCTQAELKPSRQSTSRMVSFGVFETIQLRATGASDTVLHIGLGTVSRHRQQSYS